MEEQKSFVIVPQSVSDPLPFDEIFDPARPVEVDIGCGKGRFLIARASANPDVQYLGIERMLERVRRVNKKAVRLGLENVRILRLEAAYSLAWMLPLHRIRTFYVFFPDPWPKRRHHKNRLVSPAFADLVWSRLEPGGTIQLATDHLDYHAEMRRVMAADPRFEEVPAMERTPEEQTDFELIFRGQGLPIGASAYRSLPG